MEMKLTPIWITRKVLFTGVAKLKSVVGNLAAAKIKMGWLIILAALMQKLPFVFSAPSSLEEIKKAFIIMSYVLLLWALSRNFHLWSVRVLALGTLLNFVSIATNGGLMPVSPETRLQAGMTPIGESGFGKLVPKGTGVLLPLNQTNLWLLSDIIPVPVVGGVFSPGDVVIAVGLLAFFAEVGRQHNFH